MFLPNLSNSKAFWMALRRRFTNLYNLNSFLSHSYIMPRPNNWGLSYNLYDFMRVGECLFFSPFTKVWAVFYVAGVSDYKPTLGDLLLLSLIRSSMGYTYCLIRYWIIWYLDLSPGLWNTLIWGLITTHS